MTTTLARFGSVVALLALVPVARAEETRTGEQIYKQMCLRCHGANGEGTKKYELPLTGDKSLAQLATVIDRTMPEGDPDALDAEGSKRVAAYMYDAFYSPTAQAKLNPPRVELSRLTVKQYRNSVADLIGTFRGAPKPDDKQGLRGEYFNSRNFRNRGQIDRIDGEVNFNFQKEPPKADAEPKEKFDANQFSIRWEGSVWAPDTGVYEFVVKTDHALRLYVNDNRKAAIDAWVKSGDGTEFRASVFLLAGRAYPIRLEFSKAKQGVDDSKKNPNPPVKPAFVSLNWKRPNRAVEVIPGRYLTPQKFPEVAVIETPFPPDDRSLGWERGTTVSKEWDAATTEAAFETAAYVVARLPELAGTQPDAADRVAKLKTFCRRFAESAFRRPLTDEEKVLFVERQFEAAGDPELAVKRVVLIVLKSPRFLYPDAAGGSEQYATAVKLSYTLWDTAPDLELLNAANARKLGTREEVQKQAERMLGDPRAKTKLREFLITWLKLDQVKDVVKDTKKFPGFDAELASDLRSSLELFLDDVMASPEADYRQLLLSNEMYLNGRVAKFYGFDLAAGAPFQKVKFEPDRRSGIVTHPYVLSSLAYLAESSPIHRGVFVGRGLLGVNIKPPQAAFTPLAADLHPKLTTRERVALQTSPMACAGCHGIMNPLGFSLENFDAVGRYREKENDKPIDAAGSYETRAGDTVKFTTAKELAKFLANSEETQYAFAQQAFHFYVKQPVRAYGLTKPEELRKTFAENSYNVRKLLREIAVTVTATKPDQKPPK
jgi:mono/diheme cytochrome c family protein